MSNKEDDDIQNQIIFLENTLRAYLSREALTRYFTIKTTNPSFAIQIAAFVHQAVNQKYIKGQLTDTEFKDLIRKLQEPEKKFKIRK